jgi:hypothetical protein
MFMVRPTRVLSLSLFPLLAFVSPALPCSLCGGNPQTAVTIRQAVAQAKMVLYGTMTNPRLNPANVGSPGSGTTQFRIEKVLKSHPFLANKKVLEIPRYIPVDPKAPPRYVLFCDLYKGQGDPYRGMVVNSRAALDYVRGALTLAGQKRTQILLYAFRYLDHLDPDLANDAFLEFAKANDQEIGQVAARLSPAKLRGLVLNSKTPAERLGLYAFLLGGCGTAQDATLLRSLLDKRSDNTSRAFDGLLSGYIRLRPREGWALAVAVLRDARKPFADRYAVLRTLRFYHGWKPAETRRQVLAGLAAALDQGDIADMAVEDLRRWHIWDLTPQVLAQYGKKSHAAPIMRRTIVRYALTCPRPEAARFLAEVRKQDPEIIADVKEALEFEKAK